MKKTGKFAVIFLLLLTVIGLGCYWESRIVLRIYDYKTGKIYVEVPAKEGDKLFFGWVHSWEKIPWHEFYHIGPGNTLVLEKICFPAFGAGIPENKGKKCYVQDGMIYMDEIGQVFPYFVWINSHFATREIKLNNVHISSGKELPEHTRVILAIGRRVDKWLRMIPLSSKETRT